MRYLLSLLVPVPMESTYMCGGALMSAKWWQWRDRCFHVRTKELISEAR